MKRSTLALSVSAAVLATLMGCSKQEPAADAAARPAASKPADPLEAVAAQGKGFTVGAMMNANAVYVFFDAQCPHCAHLWEASVPLHRKAKFIWIPVGLINPSSSSQGAALLASADPGQSMAEHEKSMRAGQGGISASSSVNPAMADAIKSNTRLFNNLGIESVPFIVARNPRSGLTVTRNGSMATAALAELIGVDAP